MLLAIVKEMIFKVARENPSLVFLTLTISLLVGGAVFGYAYTLFALKDDVAGQFETAKEETQAVVEKVVKEVGEVSSKVTALSQQTADLDRNTRIRAAEAVIRALDAEIFDLEELIRAGAATDKQRARYVQLKSDKSDQERRLLWITK